jgi:hypothetical protein
MKLYLFFVKKPAAQATKKINEFFQQYPRATSKEENAIILAAR